MSNKKAVELIKNIKIIQIINDVQIIVNRLSNLISKDNYKPNYEDGRLLNLAYKKLDEALAELEKEERCEYKKDVFGFYDTSCGKYTSIKEEFCPFDGKKIVVKEAGK